MVCGPLRDPGRKRHKKKSKSVVAFDPSISLTRSDPSTVQQVIAHPERPCSYQPTDGVCPVDFQRMSLSPFRRLRVPFL